jgi:hypothetical protein
VYRRGALRGGIGYKCALVLKESGFPGGAGADRQTRFDALMLRIWSEYFARSLRFGFRSFCSHRWLLVG